MRKISGVKVIIKLDGNVYLLGSTDIYVPLRMNRIEFGHVFNMTIDL